MVRQRVLSVQCFSALAAEVLASPVMQLEKQFPHHGAVSCFEHSVAVTSAGPQILSVGDRGIVRYKSQYPEINKLA